MDQPATSKEALGAFKAVPDKQDGAQKLTSEEEVIKAKVEHLHQDGLDKLEAGEETEEKRGPPKQKEDREKPIEEERVMEGKEEDGEKGDPRMESDSLTPQDRMSPPSEDAEGTAEQEGEVNTEEEEEEEQEQEEEEDEDEGMQTLRPPSELWNRCKKKIIGDGGSDSGAAPSHDRSSASGVRRRLSSLPLSYFSSIAKIFTPDHPAAQEEEKPPIEEKAKQPKYRPVLSRLFTFVPEEGKPKAVLRKPTMLLGENISRTFKMISQKSSHDDTKQDKVDSDVATETEHEDDRSRSPGSLQSKPEEGGSGSEKQDQPGSAQSKKLNDDFSSSSPGLSSSVWSMGQRISHWKMAHNRGYHAGQLTQDKIYKHKLLKHERDTKAAVPLPLQALMEEEVYAILKAILHDYQKKLGVHHALTVQMEEAVDHLHLKLTAKGAI